MKKIADVAAHIFIFAVVVLSIISIFGVWDFFSGDVISKSFQSIGLLACVAVIILIADHFLEQKSPTPVIPDASENLQPVLIESQPAIIFKGIRVFTLSLLVIAVALLALLGVAAIWEVLSGEILHKALASIAIIGFSSLIIVITCLERESNSILYRKNISPGIIIFVIIIAFILISTLSDIFYY